MKIYLSKLEDWISGVGTKIIPPYGKVTVSIVIFVYTLALNESFDALKRSSHEMSGVTSWQTSLQKCVTNRKNICP